MNMWFPHVGAHSVSWLFVHVVWATRARQPTITPSLDAPLERELRRLAVAHGASMHACGAHDDHLHVLVQLPPTVGVSALVNHMKGASSHTFRRSGLRWQTGYWVESVNRSGLIRAARYVSDQRRLHHAALRNEPWSRADVDAPWSPPSAAGL